jgi:CubicO group peptidase (beta-lactamase class C family)
MVGFTTFVGSMKRTFLIIWLLFLTLATGLLYSCGEQPAEKKVVEELPLKINLSYITNLDSIVFATKAAELDKKFERLRKLTGFNGAVLYAEKGHLVFKKAYGNRDVRHRKGELSTQDVFQLASVSKMFSAMSIMILKNEGQLDFDEDIRTYIPTFPYENITCRLLMTHRAGLPRYMSLAHDKWSDKHLPMDNDDMLDLFVEYQPDIYFKPDNGFHYCNSNYAVLANVVEAVSGKHFEDFVQEKIFAPLKMDSSFVYNMRDDSAVGLYVERGVPGYYHRGRRWREMENDYLNGVMGDKNVYTSVEDLYKFDRALDQFTLVPDSILQQAFTGGSPKYWKRKDNYGFGWRTKDGMDSVVYHFGWWKGFRTFYIRDMRHHKTLIVLTNKDKGPGSANFWNIIKADTLPLGLKYDLME